MPALKNFSFAQLLKGRSLTLGSSLATLGSAALLAMPAPAQITPDATLGNEGSVVVPDAFVRGDLADLIEGGAVRGENLFHSFLEFNVGDGQRVYFANPDGIGAILSRITGSDPSDIFGTLGVDGSADLFFINPNGILFGEDAVLDIEGSFYGTTADAIELGDAIFSAVEPGQSRLLTVNPGVLIESYLSSNSGNIENRGQLVAGETLSLAGNRLNLQGQLGAGVDLRLVASDTVQIRDTAAVPFVALAGGDLLVQGNQQVDIVALSHAESGLYAYGDLVLRSPNPVGGDAHYWSGSNFRVEGLDGSLGDLASPFDPIIRSVGNVEIETYEGTSLHILAGGSVTLGTAVINAPEQGGLGIDFLQETIALSDGTVVEIDGGAQPTLDVRAGVDATVIGTPPLEVLTGFEPTVDAFEEAFVTAELSSADITVGDIWMRAPGGLVLLTNQYAPDPQIAGGTISVTGEGVYGDGIVASSQATESGTVFLDARGDIAVVNSYIFTSGVGEVGDIVLIAEGTVRFDSSDGSLSGAFSQIQSDVGGIGGDVRISARNLEVINGARLDASSFGLGAAGNVILEVAETARFDDFDSSDGSTGGAFSRIGSSGEGTGGDVRISAQNLEVTNGAQLSASSLGLGAAGSVLLTVAETARFDGFDSSDGSASGAFSRIGSGGEGTGGEVRISAQNLEVTNGAQLSASSLGLGAAGSVLLTVAETARFDGFDSSDGSASGAFSSIELAGEGTGGDVRISARKLEVTNGAQLSVSSFGLGDAGSVILEVTETARFVGTAPIDGSPSGAFSSINFDGEGTSGDVKIRANTLEVLDGAQLNASNFGQGEAGNVILEITDTARFVGTDADGSPSGAFSSLASFGEGTSGDVEILAANLEVLQGAVLFANSLGMGDAGNVRLVISDQIFVDDGTIGTNAENGSGGQVNIQAGNLILRNDSDIQTFVASGEGQGGDITILADFVIALDDSDILAFSIGGSGGNIDLSQTPFFGENLNGLGQATFFSRNLNIASQTLSVAEDLFALDGNDQVDIRATGQITIDETDFVENSLTETSGNLVSTVTFTEDSCIAGSFTITGGGGLPQKPGDAMISTYAISTVQTLPETTTTRPVLQQPDGVYRLADGRLVLSHQCGSGLSSQEPGVRMQEPEDGVQEAEDRLSLTPES